MIRVTDLDEVKKDFKVGDKFLFQTKVWLDINTCKRMKIKGTIKGVYKNGIVLGFWHSNWKENIELKRWLSYKDILLDRLSGNIPYATTWMTYNSEGSC